MHAQDPVNRLMTEAVLSVDADEPAGEVLRLFAGYPIHHLPVIRDGVVIGMLSSADVMKLELFLPKSAVSPIEYLNRKMRVEALIRRPVIAVSAHQSVEDAARLMAKHGIHGLPVVDHGGHLLGIITTTDIIHAAISASASGGPAPTVGQATGDAIPHLSPAELDHAIAAAKTAVTAGQDTSGLADALLFLRHRVAALEEVVRAATRYLTAGQDEHLHAVLLKAIEQAHRADAHAATERDGALQGAGRL